MYVHISLAFHTWELRHVSILLLVKSWGIWQLNKISIYLILLFCYIFYFLLSFALMANIYIFSLITFWKWAFWILISLKYVSCFNICSRSLIWPTGYVLACVSMIMIFFRVWPNYIIIFLRIILPIMLYVLRIATVFYL
jgi:hypothetical protein